MTERNRSGDTGEERADKERPGENDKEEGGAGQGDACRCKEVAEMSPFEMLKLMLRDLAFWKKDKRPK
ncbi:MAG: hypothetical protein AB1805_02220 [Nitrospirota bacterium]